jgi:TPR repeat protein
MLKKTVLALFLSCAVSLVHADPKDETSVRIFQAQMQLAQSGDAAGQYYVGEMYEKGLGTDQDLKIAHAWYTKSAAQGNALAKDKLANWERIQQEIANAKEGTARAKQIAIEAAKAEQRAAEAARAKQAEAKEKERQSAEARAKQLAQEKERAAKEAKARPVPVSAPVTPQPVPAAQATKAAVKTPPTTEDKNDPAFSANPCKGPSAKFLSTCK